jgi:DNA-binding MarR family transcriptional regulator
MIDQTREDALNAALLLMHFGYRALIQGPDRLLARHGLSRVHHRILFCVGRNPGLTVGDLLATLRVTKQAMNAPLRRLIQDGWISAEPPPENRRQKRLHLTERGAELEHALSGDQRDRFARIFAQVGPGAEAHWREVMRLMAEGLDAPSMRKRGDAEDGEEVES